jgi:hypothetical protein
MNLQEQKILNGAVIGYEFEFYSNMERKQIAREIGLLIKKKVDVYSVYHSEERSGTSFAIEPDLSGGVRMHELITTPMSYNEAITVMIKILGWIKANGWTDEKCACHINLSFDKNALGYSVKDIDKLKYILGFDENLIYDKFPNRKNSIYARSIKHIFPISKFQFSENIDTIYKENYELPNDKYYGINFTKLHLEYIEARYCGGKNYEKKAKDLSEITKYITLYTASVLQRPGFDENDLSKLRGIIKEHKKVVRSFSDPEAFLMNYPNMTVLVDMKGDIEILKTFFVQIREKLFDLIIKAGVRKGIMNYDADVSTFQIKDAIIRNASMIKDMEILNSKITGNLVNCDLYKCDVTKSHLFNCKIVATNKISKSKVINSPIHMNNIIDDCYIDNKKNVINGTVNRGIIRSGDIGPISKISKDTEIIDQSKIDQASKSDKDKKNTDMQIKIGVIKAK